MLQPAPDRAPDERWLSLVLHLHDPGFLSDADLDALVPAPLRALERLLLERGALRLSLYLPGRVLESAARTVPQTLASLREAGRALRLEWLGGGYHHPVFPLIPESWRRAQLQMLNQALRIHVGAEPRGAWLPEFVWDPALIGSFAQMPFEFTVLKDYQVGPAGNPEALPQGGWFATEELGVPFRLISAQEGLAALFRAGALEEMLRLPLAPAEGEGPAVGVVEIPLLAPTRAGFEPVFLDRLAQLAGLCDDGKGGVRTRLLSDLVDLTEPLGNVHVPASTSRGFCAAGPGGGVRDQLLRHPEMNWFHKKTLHLLGRLEQTGVPRLRTQATEPLLRAQNVSFYRDGDDLSGVRFLRDRAAGAALLLEAESILDEGLADDSTRVDISDFVCDGTRQIHMRHGLLGLLIEHRKGGRLSSLEFKPRSHNWAGAFTRQPGDLHEPGLADPYLRALLVEHFFPVALEPGDVLSGQAIELGDFLGRPFDYQIKRNKGDTQAMLARSARIRQHGASTPLLLEKALTLRAGKSQVTATYKLSNTGNVPVRFRFAVESNFSPGEWVEGMQRHRLHGAKWGSTLDPLRGDAVSGYTIEDIRAGVSLDWEFKKPADTWILPLTTPSFRTPEGWRFQGVCAVPTWIVSLGAGESWSLILRLDLGKIRKV